MRCLTRRPAPKAAASATSTRKACFARNRLATSGAGPRAAPPLFLPAVAGADTIRSKTMTKALKGVRILDFTHVQSGPACTQLLAWFGADVIKIERPGVGDLTRGQLREVPNPDSLYFTMLNHNKRSITIDSKPPRAKKILNRVIRA